MRIQPITGVNTRQQTQTMKGNPTKVVKNLKPAKPFELLPYPITPGLSFPESYLGRLCDFGDFHNAEKMADPLGLDEEGRLRLLKGLFNDYNSREAIKHAFLSQKIKDREKAATTAGWEARAAELPINHSTEYRDSSNGQLTTNASELLGYVRQRIIPPYGSDSALHQLP